MSEHELLLEVKNAKKYFPVKKGFIAQKVIGYVRAVDGVTFNLYKGETLGVIGESGCGKTTLSRLIIGLDDATEGEVLFRGEKLSTQMRPELRQKIQMVFQDPYSSIDPRMNIRRIIEEPLRIHTHLSKAQKLERVLPIIKKVGIPESALAKYPHEFSGGQRQRIGIARALISEPELILCDEPVSALDVSVQAQVLNLFKSLQKENNLTYIFISHDMSVIRHVSDRIAVMYLGQMVEVAPKKLLFEKPLHPYTSALMDAIPVPDPTAEKKHSMLKGDIPSPIEIPRGCSFQTRCPHCMGICRECSPQLREVEPDHFAACHLFDKEGAQQ